MIFRQQEKIEALKTFGYRQREAEFLFLVGKYSKVFTMSQFNNYCGIKAGAAVDRFRDKVRLLGHADMAYLRRGKPVIFGLETQFHNLIGRENSTNPRRDADIRTRLMGLDYVISNPAKGYLYTENEKVEQFRSVMNVVPSRTYKIADTTVRHYFTENFPIAVDSQGRYEFVYIDRDSGTFRSFCETHRPLFAALDNCRLVFACTDGQAASEAATTFRAVMRGTVVEPEVVAEFVERESLEAKVLHLSFAEMERLRALRESRWSMWFERWRKLKDSECRAEFSSYILRFGYDFLRGDRRGDHTQDCLSTPLPSSASASAE